MTCTRRKARRAGALLLVLAILPLLAIVALLLLNDATMQTNIVDRYWNGQKAQQMARSAATTAYVEILKNRAYGADQQAVVSVPFPESGDPQAYGIVTFRQDSRTAYSVNNSGKEASVPGFGGSVVPRDSIVLVGVGRYRGVEKRWMVLLKTPPFDRALSSSGTIRSNEGLLVGAVVSPDALEGGLTRDELKPSALVSNGQDGSDGAALRILGDAEIYGELKAVGSIRLAETVKGDHRTSPNSKPEELPKILLEKYDPEKHPSLQRLGKDTYDAEKTFSGYAKYSGSQVTFEKGVTLDHGVLYVDGDLVIDGPLSGSGAVFCTGKVTLRGGADLSSDNHAAIVAQGDVRILGNGSQRSFFRGLIWTGGEGGFSDQDADQDLLVRDVTVQGCVVNAGQGSAGDGSAMQVDRSRVLFEEQAAQLILEPGFSGNWPIAVEPLRGGVRGSLSLKPVSENGKTFTPSPAHFARLGTALGPADFVFTDDSGQVFQAGADGTVPSELRMAFENGPSYTVASDWQAEIDAAKQNTAVTNHGVFKLDLNEFLTQESRLKVVMRKLD
jgi:hypothetical protein